MNLYDEMGAAWRDDAACRGVDSNVFFPAQGAIPHRAYQICEGCPVKQQCYDFADAAGEMRGVWGGVSFSRRSRFNRGMQVTKPRRTDVRA